MITIEQTNKHRHQQPHWQSHVAHHEQSEYEFCLAAHFTNSSICSSIELILRRCRVTNAQFIVESIPEYSLGSLN